MTEAAKMALRRVFEVLSEVGLKPPTNATIFAALRAGDVGFKDAEAKAFLASLRGAAQGRTGAGPLESNTNAPGGLGPAPATCDAHDAGAGGEESLKDRAERLDAKDLTTPPPPSQPEPERPALFAVPDQPVKTKTTRVPMATRFAGTTVENFGPHAALVRDLLGVEGNLGGRRGTIGGKTLDALLQRLAFWLETYGPEAFIHGLRVGISSGNGVAYGGGAMRRYDPERDAAGRFARAEAPAEPEDDMPTALDLAESEGLTWELPPEELAKRPAGLVARLAARG